MVDINVDSFAIIASIGLAYLIIRDYLNGYFREKGSNLATKQDIEEITGKIESVKIQYGIEMEKLKSYIQIGVKNESMIQEKTNDALIQFFEDSMFLHDAKMTINIGDLPIDHGESLNEYWDYTGSLFIKIFSDYYKLLIYIEDNHPLIQAAQKIYNDVLKLHEIFKEDFFDLKSGLISMYTAKLSDEDFKKALIENKQIHDEYIKKIIPLNLSVKSNLDEYIKFLNMYLKNISHGHTIKKISK